MPEILYRASRVGIVAFVTSPHLDSRLNTAGKTPLFPFEYRHHFLHISHHFWYDDQICQSQCRKRIMKNPTIERNPKLKPKSRCLTSWTLLLLTIFILTFMSTVYELNAQSDSELRFEVSFPSSIHPESITGRVFIVVSKENDPEPRFQTRRSRNSPFFGKDIERLRADEVVTIDDDVLGFPLTSIREIPPGEYFVQAFINIYTEFKRSDGHTIWLHNDQWEGQQWNRSPGNLYSDVKKVRIDTASAQSIRLVCGNVIPPIQIPPDTEWVKRIKFQSKILSEFWGQPIYIGATILLPKDYNKDRKTFYPVNYQQGHFSLNAPNGFRTDDPGENDRRGHSGYEFYKTWISDACPRMITVTFQHPCPYFDDSYAVNSANCGPYGDAIMSELIPEIESRFRIIREPWARILEGGSTGGWEALALQIFHPDFFGGAFAYCPDPIEFSDVEGVHVYEDKNAFHRRVGWREVPIPDSRRADGSLVLTSKQIQQYEHVLGTKGRSGEQWDIWQAVWGPVGEDGYTQLLIDKVTGKIDPQVVQYWKDHYDLKVYLEKNWAAVGPKIAGKLYIFTGDMDTYYLNNPVHRFQEFLARTRDPHVPGFFMYAPRKIHCWTGPFTPLERIQFIANHIIKNAPKDEKTPWWTKRQEQNR